MSSQSHPLFWRNGAFQFGNQPLGFSNDNNNNAGGANAGAEAKAEETVARPKRQTKPKFTADYLIADNGLPLIYNEFSQINFSKSPGKEAQNLKLLMTKYKEWMYQLYPLNFEDLTKKVETFSGHRLVRNELDRLRNRRDGVVDASTLDNDLDGVVINPDNLDDENENENENEDFVGDFTNLNSIGPMNAASIETSTNNESQKRILPDFVKQSQNANANTAGKNDAQNANTSDNNNNNNDNNNKNNNGNGNVMDLNDFEMEPQVIDVASDMTNNMQAPGDDEDELADMLWDEY